MPAQRTALPDGRWHLQHGPMDIVLAAEGDADAVDRFERAVRHGPPAARVDDVDVTENVPSGARGFSTR